MKFFMKLFYSIRQICWKLPFMEWMQSALFRHRHGAIASIAACCLNIFNHFMWEIFLWHAAFYIYSFDSNSWMFWKLFCSEHVFADGLKASFKLQTTIDITKRRYMNWAEAIFIWTFQTETINSTTFWIVLLVVLLFEKIISPIFIIFENSFVLCFSYCL